MLYCDQRLGKWSSLQSQTKGLQKMTLLKKLENFLELVEMIAGYELGNPEYGKYIYREHLRELKKLAQEFDMLNLAAQCSEKLDAFDAEETRKH